MTEFELLYLLEEIRINNSSIFMDVFTLASAYLIVAFLLAHRLTRPITILMNFLFVGLMLTTAFQQLKLGDSFVYIVEQMQLMAENGDGLQMHPVRHAPLWTVYLFGPGSAVFTIMIMLGSLFFFFHARKIGGARSGGLLDGVIGKSDGND